MTILEIYIWVINALYDKGEHGLSLKKNLTKGGFATSM